MTDFESFLRMYESNRLKNIQSIDFFKLLSNQEKLINLKLTEKTGSYQVQIFKTRVYVNYTFTLNRIEQYEY